MIVMKFGLTSIDSAGAIERIAKIVASKRLPMVVVSAMVKVTDQLVPWGRRRRAEIAMPRSSYTNTFFPRP
jgi:aspartokinase